MIVDVLYKLASHSVESTVLDDATLCIRINVGSETFNTVYKESRWQKIYMLSVHVGNYLCYADHTAHTHKCAVEANTHVKQLRFVPAQCPSA